MDNLCKAARMLAAFALSAGVATTALASDLPPVPDAIAEADILRFGTKCDFPPYGYLDTAGKPVGVEVELGKKIAEYAFGDATKTEIVCVTSSNRIPSLLGGKIDLILATLGINEERKEVIDFTDPYFWDGSDVVVPVDSEVQDLEDLDGKTVITIKGAWQIPWLEKNMPDVTLLKLDTVSDALQALLQGRAQGYAHDFALLSGLANKNDSIRMVGDLFAVGYGAGGVRKGEPEWRAFVDAAIKKAVAEGLTDQWLEEHVQPDLIDAMKQTWDLDNAPRN